MINVTNFHEEELSQAELEAGLRRTREHKQIPYTVLYGMKQNTSFFCP